MNESKGNILIVDDTTANLRLLVDILSKQGYTVRPAPSGQWALSTIEKNIPDLILLDILMPDMDGYELCRHLKADERTRDIPIIFISALNEVFDKVTAFSIGGVDYITKPFQEAEMLSRIHTHLSLRKMQQDLEQKNIQLRQQNKELDAFSHTVAHDLKNPLSIIMGYSQILGYDNLATLTEVELQEIGQAVYRSSQDMVDIVDALLLLAGVRKMQVHLEPLAMGQIVDKVMNRLKGMITDLDADIILPDSWPLAAGYGPWVAEIWTNYISNGLKYGDRPPRIELGATIEEGGRNVRFWAQDNGAGISEEAQTTLFTEFTRLNEVRIEGHGLGLSIVRRIMDKLGGEVGLTSELGQGSRFYFTLPILDEEFEWGVGEIMGTGKR